MDGWVMKLECLVSCLWGTMSLSSMRCQVLFSVFFSLLRPRLWIGLNSLQRNNYKKCIYGWIILLITKSHHGPSTPHTGCFDANSADIVRLPAALEGGLVDGFHLQAWWLWGRRGKKIKIFQPCLSELLSSCSASLMVAAWAAQVRRDLETTNNGKATEKSRSLLWE